MFYVLVGWLFFFKPSVESRDVIQLLDYLPGIQSPALHPTGYGHL